MLDPYFLLVVFVIAVVSGATAAVIGFGIGSLMTPLLVTRFPPDVAVAVVALPHLLATAVRFVQHRRAIDLPTLRRFGIPSAIGGFLGAMLLSRFDTSLFFAVLGVLLIATGAMNLVARLQQWRPRRSVAVVLGFLSGLFGGIAGNQGGLRAAGLSTFGLEPRAFLATSTAVALVIDAARTPVYLARSASQLLPLATPIGIAAVGCLLGTIAGERLFLRLSPDVYRRIVGIAVVLLGVWLVVKAV